MKKRLSLSCAAERQLQLEQSQSTTAQLHPADTWGETLGPYTHTLCLTLSITASVCLNTGDPTEL